MYGTTNEVTHDRCCCYCFDDHAGVRTIRVIQRAIHLTPYILHLTPYALRLTPYTLHLTPYATEATDRRIVRVPGQCMPHFIVIDLDS